ncbi:MAG: ribulose-phosphate 3-epimerase [Gammaproteobacteria bacterium RIFCSPHIGHO2_12_FULL_38_11]|nr:MAG: ribulose-phosphate 3-epimerase [Gammaproteobacteria bacterium RIFCSPHIGHO2_12_FULL_38_11]
MSNKIIIAASILSADFAILGQESKNILSAGAHCLHFDVMDHHFVPNLSFGSVVCQALRNAGITAEIDVHLMVTDPECYIEPFARAGATRLTFHPAALKSPNDIKLICDKIHDASMQAGLAFNPDKPVHIDKALFSEFELILLMSVFAGFGGQSFIPESVEKIRETKKLINKYNPNILLGIDGGIKVNNIKQVINAGANFIVMGSELFGTDDYALRIKQLYEEINRT